MPIDQALQFLVDEFHSILAPQTVQFIVFLSPLALALCLLVIFNHVWVEYVRSKFRLSLKYATLEIRLPKDTFKSPLAMETFLHAIHNTSDGSLYNQFWKGEYRPHYSLELVSVEGQVKFFIWCEDRRKGGVMSALYSQFPGIEIIDKEDYTKSVHYDPKTMKVWGTEFILTKEDAYPIKTYVDYGLDKDPKEELKVDPLVPVLEFLGSVGPNQQLWMQWVVRAHKKDQRKAGHLFKKTDQWKDDAAEIVNKIMMRDAKTKISGTKDKDSGRVIPPTLSEGEKNIVAAIERSLEKVAFDVGIRVLYIAKKDVFSTPFGIGGVMASFKQFSTENLNGFKPNGDVGLARLGGLPWEDYKDIRRNKITEEILGLYKRRNFFYSGSKHGKTIVLNAEELATMYHFPGSVATTPGIQRVSSKKAEAPTNLPL
ncbi:MAG: hypothetical protein AAB381_02685 [Patescibacteria group bacterium]